MKDHPCRSTIRRGWVVALVAGALLACPPARGELLYEDARISGRELHSFSDAGRDVLVVLGEFRLNAGTVRLSGRDAVVWISPMSGGRMSRHAITVYVESNARHLHNDKVVARGEELLATLELEGAIATEGPLSQQSLVDYPLYQRAMAARQRGSAAPPAAPSPRAAMRERAQPDGQAEATPTGRPPITGEPPTGQLPTGEPVTAPAEAAEATQPPAEPSAEAAPPPAPQPAARILKPVYWFADQTSGEERGEGEQWRRVVVLRGGVYLYQGDPDSDQFLELRSQSAVLFFRKSTGESKPAETPYSPSLDAKPGQETPDGVYLEGDVVLSRGDRTLHGPAAYYDFTSGRALVLDPVFRTVQEQRNIPIYIRADEARVLSAREILFKNAKLTSSDFVTPSYAIAAKSAYFKDIAPYDEQGERLSPPRYQVRLKHLTWNLYDVPVFYWPYTRTNVAQGHTPLRKLSFGSSGRFGWGVESQWHLFRLLGLVQPEGFRGLLDLDAYNEGLIGGASLHYSRRDYSGYTRAYGVIDNRGEDEFGDNRTDIPAPDRRGRVLARHKQLLPDGWLLQAELGYVSDENFMEEYFPAEHFAGKEQETLLYARKQQDNWAFWALLQYRLNRFDTQTDAAPDLGFALVGQPLLNDSLTYYNESRAGLVRWRPDRDSGLHDSDWMQRLDTRNEIDVPLHAGPVNIMPYATGRLTNWGDAPAGGDHNRAYGQLGVRANTHLWRVYNSASSRLLDVNRLRHIITPEAAAFVSDNGGVGPDKLFPMDPSIEEHLIRLGGGAVGIYQRLQTKRGPIGQERNVDWMRLNLVAMFFDTNQGDGRLSNGDFYWYRPEHSLPRNSLNGQYSWQISDSMAFLSNANYDLNRGIIGQADAGVAISRNPRARYYLGWRWLQDLESDLVTAGLNYQLTRKYSLSVFEQYDFDYGDGRNTAFNAMLTRKFERWYAGISVTFVRQIREEDELAVMFTLWPEGVPELQLGTRQLDLFGSSDSN